MPSDILQDESLPIPVLEENLRPIDIDPVENKASFKHLTSLVAQTSSKALFSKVEAVVEPRISASLQSPFIAILSQDDLVITSSLSPLRSTVSSSVYLLWNYLKRKYLLQYFGYLLTKTSNCLQKYFILFCQMFVHCQIVFNIVYSKNS